MAEDMRLKAVVDDRASGPLVTIRKNLEGIKTPPALAQIAGGLQQIEQRARSLSSSVGSGLMTGLGLGGAGALAGAIAGVVQQMGRLASATRELKYLSRESGMSTEAIRTLQATAKEFDIPTANIDKAISVMSGKMAEFRRNYSDLQKQLGVRMSGVAPQLKEFADKGDFEGFFGTAMGAMSKIQGKDGSPADREYMLKQYSELFFGDSSLSRMFSDPDKLAKVLREKRAVTRSTPLDKLEREEEELNRSQKQFGEQLDKLLREAGPSFLKTATLMLQGAEQLTPALKKFGDVIDRLGSLIGVGGGVSKTSLEGTGLGGTGLGGLIHRASLTSGASLSSGASIGNRLGGGSGAQIRGPMPPPASGPGIGHVASRAEREAFIRKEAAARGIDPDIAMRIARSEGFNRYTGDGGRSFGDWQLFTGGGLGNEFTKETGLDPSNPSTWKTQTRWALDHAAKNRSWRPWHGRGPAGVGVNEGFGKDAGARGWKGPDGERSESNGSFIGDASRAAREAGLHVTSSYRGPNHPLSLRNPRSAHARGMAFDSRAKTEEEADAAMGRIHAMMKARGLQEGRDYRIRDEVRNRVPWSTGPHVHTEFTAAGAKRWRGDGSDLPQGDVPRSANGAPHPFSREALERAKSSSTPLVGNWPSGWKPPASLTAPPDAKKMPAPNMDGNVHITIENGSGNMVRVKDMDGVVKGSTIKRHVQGNGGDWT